MNMNKNLKFAVIHFDLYLGHRNQKKKNFTKARFILPANAKRI